MESTTRNRLKKYILKPHIVMYIALKKLRKIIRYYEVICTAKVNKVQVNFGNRIVFNQRTVITGRGSISIGDRTSFGYVLGGYFHKGFCELQPRYEKAKIIIGNDVATNNNLLICCADEVIIEDNTLIGEGVMMIDHNAHGIHPDERRTNIGTVAPIYVGENVWIGSRVIILPGTKIGNNSIVGAGSVIKGEFPANVMISGNPGKVIRSI
ncbi:MAG: acyltransferase [Peptococcaceae bacterium]|nr:acyltransferase [Peptococcaceae bacterium]